MLRVEDPRKDQGSKIGSRIPERINDRREDQGSYKRSRISERIKDPRKDIGSQINGDIHSFSK